MPRIDDGRERAAFLGRAVGRRPAHPAVTHPKKTLRAKAAHPACLRFSAGCLRCARRAGAVRARSAAARPGGWSSFRPVRPFVRQPLRSAAQAERGRKPCRFLCHAAGYGPARRERRCGAGRHGRGLAVTRSTVQRAVADWFAQRGWKPFPFQKQVWKAMAEGRSGLLHATTGAGKTFAVWLGALQALAGDPEGSEPNRAPAQRVLGHDAIKK